LNELTANDEPVQVAETGTRATAGPSAASVPALKSAAKKDVALVKQCGRQPDGTCAMDACACEGDIA